MKKSDGGAAFPRPIGNTGGPGPGKYSPSQPGMSLRDYFATAALQGIMATLHPSDDFWGRDGCYEGIAKKVYEIADAMLCERKKEE